MSRAHRFPDIETGLLCAAIALPWLLDWLGQGYHVSFAVRLLIYALAATSLNLVLGYGGMVAFGHASFFGAGAYVVALLMEAGVASAWAAWPAALLVAALMGAVIGALSLRTQGVYFIMITLAFAQMIYYIVVSMQLTGGDDGLALPGRSTLAPFDLGNDTVLYWVSLGMLTVTLWLLKRLAQARFGHALAGIRDNPVRMAALGYPVERFKLVCFVIGAALAGLAGALLANQSGMASPGQLYWTQSGMLLVMVILGGVGHRYGGVIGAIVLLGLEEGMAMLTPYSQLFIGLILLGVVFRAPHGLAGWAGKRA